MALTLRSDLLEFGQGALDVVALAVEVGDVRFDFAEQQLRLSDLAGVAVIQRQVFGDVFQRETKILAAQDQLQPRPVTAAVGPVGTEAGRNQQATRLIEPYGARGDVELVSQFADGEVVLFSANRLAIVAMVRHGLAIAIIGGGWN